MNKSGYVKFDRKILNWTWYSNVNTFKLFFHFIISANYADGNFLGIDVKRGQLARSYNKLSEETGLTVNEIRTAIKNLKLTQEITQTTYAKFSVFTVVNYDKYQTVNTDFHSQGTRSSHALNTDLTRSSHGDKKKKKNNIINNNKRGDNAHAREEVITLFNSLCPSLPPVKTLTPSRIEAIDNLLATYDLNMLKVIFAKAEASDFLCGKKKGDTRDWKATFDWLIVLDNAAKVLEGNFDNKDGTGPGDKSSGGRHDFKAFEKAALEKLARS